MTKRSIEILGDRVKFFLNKNIVLIIPLLFIFSPTLNADTLGSDYTVQSNIVFNYGDDNKIHNDAKMENGFTLTARTEAISDQTATCTFDSFYPVSGFTDLNGGTLDLINNITFNTISSLGSAGKIYGNGHSITFPASDNIVGVPSSIDRGGRLRLIDRDFSYNLNSVDWSYDDKYLVSGAVANASYDELKVFTFDGTNLIKQVGLDPGGNIRSARWQPSGYYIAEAGTDTALPLNVYQYIPLTSLTLTFSDWAHASQGGSVAWSSNGKYLAFATYTPSMRIYSFNDGNINFIDEYISSGIGDPYNNALDWNSDGDKIVWGDTYGNIVVYNFDGTSLSVSTSIHIGGSDITTQVSWKKDSKNRNLILASFAALSENVKIYNYSNDSITELVSVPEASNVASSVWDYNGDRIIAGTAGGKVTIYYFNQNTDEISEIDNYSLGANCRESRFSHSSKYLGIASYDNYTSVLGFQQNYMLFDNINLVFNSDAEFIVTTTFSGLCTINGNGHKVYLNEDGRLNIDSGSQLKLKNLELVGLRQVNLQCLTDDASIIFEDCILTITSNYAFDTGSILFKGDVVISGTSKFTYSSSWSSTIDSNSVLKINKGSIFSYAPSVAKKDLIYMENDTSSLYLDNCTLHSTTTGLRLTRGSLFIKNLVTLDADGSALSQAICFGNINYTTSDLEVHILAGANLDVYGRLEYENSN